MKFTLATPQDAPQVAEAIAQIFFPHPELLPGLTYRFTLPPLQHFCIICKGRRQRAEGRREETYTSAFCLLPPALIVGTLEMIVLDNTCFITNLGVLPAARGLGVASGMLAIAHLIADKIGVKRIYLTVLPDNIAAKKLYLKFGYCELGKVVFNSNDALLMVRSL